MPRPASGKKPSVVKCDVVIVGGGVMGSSCAFRLAEAGLSVVVLEKSVPGAEASSAAAGILGAHAEAHGPGPMAELMLAGLERYADWSRDLARATGIDIEHRPSGVLKIATDAKALKRMGRETAWMKKAGREVTTLMADSVRHLEPSLSHAAGGVRFARDARVDPKLLFKAVHVAALRAGARFETGAYVREVIVERGAARGVSVESGNEYRAPKVIVAAGSWSTLVGGTPIATDAVVPARGQMVESETAKPPITHVVWGPRCYVVPRDDGRVLVGATVEFVGYRREVTARAVRDLLDAAITLVPSLGDATLRASWSNFRPYTKDGLPLLGRTHVPGLLLATGHHRNGILLAPITAEIVASLILDKSPPLDVTPFEADRLDGEAGRW